MELNKKLLIERLSSKLELQGRFLCDYFIGDEVKSHLIEFVKSLKYHVIGPIAGSATN
ncbi:hypothetical protein SAMN05660841_01151 [Sphingobacterium nematocida]|uniref:Uncharacterized protein n=1 Tax=Sphingobacterium nematocida TaxID=1513896 RepID=A0A1T5C612_9SPHI|nr:hypothetical protein [Sphingobacterium nematocida]SKB54874.1 hypothetical protein SAMN05660841_01151 [Sphingobacterium nematocida]